MRNLFVQCEPTEKVDLTIVDLPGALAEPKIHGTNSETFIACDFEEGLVLIGGTHYAGEIKKSVFSFLSYTSPGLGVLPMHSSVTTELEGFNTTVFFGLSGTGKTTLSAFEGAKLVGDDEHLWTDEGVSNIEAGCYAKAINLSKQNEPLIWDACHKFLTILENVGISETREFDFSDKTITENTRAAYPLSYIKDAHVPGVVVGHPKNIIMLTCDAFGVLPGVSRLDDFSAIYHFISGYTAKVSGTELGVSEPTATFSQCFGAPFMPRPINVYANIFLDKIRQHKPAIWLVNTGWVGGGPGVGKRMDIKQTRNIVSSIVSGQLKSRQCEQNKDFNLNVPVDTYNHDPRRSWSNQEDYDKSAAKLIQKFSENEKRFEQSDKNFADIIEKGRMLK